MTNNKALERVLERVALIDIPKVAKAQNRCLRTYRRLEGKGGWRAVGRLLDVHHVYAYDLAMYGKVPGNPDIRVKLFLPRVLPSERLYKAKRESVPRVGQGGWEGFYFRKVKVKK